MSFSDDALNQILLEDVLEDGDEEEARRREATAIALLVSLLAAEANDEAKQRQRAMNKPYLIRADLLHDPRGEIASHEMTGLAARRRSKPTMSKSELRVGVSSLDLNFESSQVQFEDVPFHKFPLVAFQSKEARDKSGKRTDSELSR